MDLPPCSHCNYKPDEYPPSVSKQLSDDGYTQDYVTANFGPEKRGTVYLCPLCGHVVGRDNPEDGIFMIQNDVEDVLSDPDKSLGEGMVPLHLQSAEGEPKICETCEELIGGDYLIEPRDDGPFYFCSTDCRSKWADEYYE